MLKENIEFFKNVVQSKNPFGENVTLVGATKTQDAQTINQAIDLGLCDVGENRAQEFRDKYPLLHPVNYHFFGRLQTNKVKYLIGKACLIQSVDSFELLAEISRLSQNQGVVTNVLLEINLGEEQKGGFPISNVIDCYQKALSYPCVTIKGLMTVLPKTDDILQTEKLCLLMREKYDILRQTNSNVTILSMGMSNDYQTAIKCGSNMIRIGTLIFGKRD